jgi:hypothetical protein
MTFKEAKQLKNKIGDTFILYNEVYKVLVAPIENGKVNHHADFFRKNKQGITDEDALNFGTDFYVVGYLERNKAEVDSIKLTENDLQ